MHCSLTVFAQILLYDGHCFFVGLPSKVTLRLLVSRNNAPQYITIFSDILMTFLILYNDCLKALECVLLQGINRAGLGASKNGEYCLPKEGIIPLIRELKIRVAQQPFLRNFKQINYKTLMTVVLHVTFDFIRINILVIMHFNVIASEFVINEAQCVIELQFIQPS